MREEELAELVRKIQRHQMKFQPVELKAAAVGFPREVAGEKRRETLYKYLLEYFLAHH